MMSIRRLVPLLLVLGACGDDGVHHLPDAPLLPIDAAVDAPDGNTDVDLTVSHGGAGTGTVTSSPAGISCGTECTATFAKDTVVTLTASATTGSVFAGWSGGCTGTLPTCDVTLSQAKSVTATFDVATYTVTVTRNGVGTGTVTGNGLACGTTCMITVDHGTMLSLAAAPGNLSVFAGWGGACSGNGACAVTVTGPTAISASFALDNLTLFVTRGGNGTGTVTSSPAGINCGSDCSETYVANQMITLTAMPGTGSTFTGWSGGGCSGMSTCTVTMTAATTVTAMFTLSTHMLTVSRMGNGSGSVTSAPAGIACGTDCMEVYNYGQMITLTPTASMGSTFTSWGGACSGSGACTVTMDAAKAVTATFTLDTHPLAVMKMGTGAGTVTGTGITCGTDCGETYNYGTMVTLTESPTTGSTFGGWGGACSGMATTCTVTMDAAKSVTATFTLNTYALTVMKLGNGSGTVTGTGISCGTDCMEVLGHGTMVTLTPMASTGSSFTSWGGACSGSGGCTVTMDMAKNVTATFTLDKFLLTVNPGGTGSGTVTGTGIACPGDCMENIDYNTMVTLTAAPSTGSTFAGWGGACSGMATTCTVTMTVARTVNATFTIKSFLLTAVDGGNGAGTITATGINCPGDCTESFVYNTMVTLTASPAMSSDFTGWSAPCAGTGTCTVTMDMARTVTATFTLKQFSLKVSTSGTGAGTVTGGGINCPTGCNATVDYGTVVTLTATPSTADATYSTFAGWSGDCSGSGGCSFTMTADMVVDAAFTLQPNIMFVTSTLQTGMLGGLSGADSICKTLAINAGLPGNYVAYLSTGVPATVLAPSRVGIAKGWIRPDGKPVMNTVDQMTAGTLFSPPIITERMADISQSGLTYVWTGTNTQGNLGAVCNPGWNGTSGEAYVGNALSQTSTVVLETTRGCVTQQQRLYCLGVDRSVLVQ